MTKTIKDYHEEFGKKFTAKDYRNLLDFFLDSLEEYGDQVRKEQIEKDAEIIESVRGAVLRGACLMEPENIRAFFTKLIRNQNDND